MEKQKMYLILDNLRSRENVGSIFRTADGAGFLKIYLCGITPTPPHEKIKKTSLGAEEYVAWEYRKQTRRLIKDLKGEDFYIIGIEQGKNSIEISKHKLSKDKKVALVLGNEVKGLSGGILNLCDVIVKIPMHGRKESLNVSVAAGVAMYALNGDLKSH